MKKLILNLSLVGLLFVSVSWNKANVEIEDNRFCAGVAWEVADAMCADDSAQCSESALYNNTNIAYGVCMSIQQ